MRSREVLMMFVGFACLGDMFELFFAVFAGESTRRVAPRNLHVVLLLLCIIFV